VHVEIDHSWKSGRVIGVLSDLIARREKPKRIRMDNGPAFIAHMIRDWSQAHKIEFVYIQPGCPTQNAYVERFNGSYRRGALDAHIFETLEQARVVADVWTHDYNHDRLHDSLNNLPPIKFGAQPTIGASPNSELEEEN
jgi:putative transposase